MNKNNIGLCTSGVDIKFEDVIFKAGNQMIFNRLSCSLDKNSILKRLK